MMAFITRSSVKPEPTRWLVWLALAISLWLVALPSRAEGINPRLASLALQDGYLVANTRFAIQLNPTLSDALDEGVPLAFRLQFRLNRPRLYAWWQQLSGGFEPTAEQQYKLSFHSLTQTWRVSVGGALYKSYPTLNDALAAEVRLSLDISQLPRPFQLSALGATDWKLESDWTPMALEGEH